MASVDPESFESLLKSSVAKSAMPALYECRDRLVTIANHILRSGVQTDSEDSAAEMSMSFLLKANEHIASLTHLTNAHCHRDAAIIARTMVEGVACLNWALQDVPLRTDQWYWFALIHEWRTLQDNESRGIPYDHEHLAKVAEKMEAHGLGYIRSKLLKASGRDADKGAKVLLPEDPWAREWTQVSMVSMIEQIDGGESLLDFYRTSSQWVHWYSPAMFRALKPDQSVRAFDEEAWPELVAAMLAALSSYAEILRLVSRLLGLNQGTVIDQAMTELQRSLRTSFLPLTMDFEH